MDGVSQPTGSKRSAGRYLVTMRWYARPEGDKLKLRVAPQPDPWLKTDHPATGRLLAYLEDTQDLVAGSRVDGRWALRLDVGLPTAKDVVRAADADNYALPLAARLKNSDLVSVWCTKQHCDHSFVRMEAAREMPAPSTDMLRVTTTASWEAHAAQEQICAALAGAKELSAGPVRLELAFVVGPSRNWLNLWKPTIDALEPLLGRTRPDRDWNRLDGRITELGMHLTVDPAFRYEAVIGIVAASTVP
jgi:hypothetical protein